MLEKHSYDRQVLLEAIRSPKRTSGLTHGFYRYPARFGAEFVREAIQYFSKQNDVVLDPFMGGGTTAVEALSLGRKFVGCDVNELAMFVTQAKSALLSERDEEAIARWSDALPELIHLHGQEGADAYTGTYKVHVPWRLRKIISQALHSLEPLRNQRQQTFARCSVLGASQWALDCRISTPSKSEFLQKHRSTIDEMLVGMRQYRLLLNEYGITLKTIGKNRVLIHSSAARLHCLKGPVKLGAPKLVLTSPPYLGVHVLYHRWQIHGRRETAAPYWIAGRSDGHTGIYYTFADRRSTAVHKYIGKLRDCFASITRLLADKAFVVQLVAFSDADIQLPIYLRALEEVGLEQCEIFGNARGSKPRPVQRDVPNRRWYALLSQQSSSSSEFMLVHRLKKKAGR